MEQILIMATKRDIIPYKNIDKAGNLKNIASIKYDKTRKYSKSLKSRKVNPWYGAVGRKKAVSRILTDSTYGFFPADGNGTYLRLVVVLESGEQ